MDETDKVPQEPCSLSETRVTKILSTSVLYLHTLFSVPYIFMTHSKFPRVFTFLMTNTEKLFAFHFIVKI